MTFDIQIVTGLLVAFSLIGCSSPHSVGQVSPKNAVPVIVDVKLYPPVGTGGGGVPTKSNVKELVLGNHSFFRKQIDISHGIAFAECSPQPKRSMGRREMDYGKAKGAASFNNSLGLDYLPPSFYYRTGYIHWYLVKYDPMGKIARILPQDRRQLFSGPSSQDLLQLASPGDQMAGVWSF